eukprot:5680382-Pleurochrysis_carterae.AAC.1
MATTSAPLCRSSDASVDWAVPSPEKAIRTRGARAGSSRPPSTFRGSPSHSPGSGPCASPTPFPSRAAPAAASGVSAPSPSPVAHRPSPASPPVSSTAGFPTCPLPGDHVRASPPPCGCGSPRPVALPHTERWLPSRLPRVSPSPAAPRCPSAGPPRGPAR